MSRRRIRIAGKNLGAGFAAGLFALTGPVFAAPVQLTEAQFRAETAQLATIVETFDGFSLGRQPSPLVIANGAYSAKGPHIEVGAWCPLSKCLGEDVAIAPTRSFGALPAGTTHWGVHVLYASTGQVVHATVTGNSGILEVDLPPSPGTFVPAGHFVGFTDPSGILSVSFREDPGVVNYSFDNVVAAIGGGTGPPTANGIPALSPVALLATAVSLLASGLLLRRRATPG